MVLAPTEDSELTEQILDLIEDSEDLPIIGERLATYDETGESITLEEFEAELLA